MSEKRTVVVAMSGGVDSSTTAALLIERGYNVIGVMMRLWSEPTTFALPGDVERAEQFVSNRCCSPEAVADARGVAQMLGIPFYLLNFEDDFKTHVVDFFLDGYARGITPNPCLECNRTLKFGTLLQKARALGADYLATGHYVRVREREGKHELLRGVDRQKDQSYALSVLTQDQLAHAIFPLGEYRKGETREMARKFGLRVSEKDESQDLCFIADGEYRNFLKRNIPNALEPGKIVDTQGKVLARHEGLPFYTIGQRKGLNVAVGEPLYVLDLDAENNAVVVGRREELGKRELVARRVNWVAGDAPALPCEVIAKIRYRASEVKATIYPHPSRVVANVMDDKELLISNFAKMRDSLPNGEGISVEFDEPLRDITPGQAVVFYDGDICLGGGIIERG